MGGWVIEWFGKVFRGVRLSVGQDVVKIRIGIK